MNDNSPLSPVQDRRWYDQQPVASACIGRLTLFPDAIQTAICSPVTVVLKERLSGTNIKNLPREIRNELVLQMWRSKRRLRAYDKNEAVYQTINYLSVMPQQHLQGLLEGLNGLIDRMVAYLEQCKSSQTAPSLDQISALAQKYCEEMGLSTAPEPAIEPSVPQEEAPLARETTVDLKEMRIRPKAEE